MLCKSGNLVLPLPRCSCHGVLASGSGGIGPGEDPSETSDALLVLEGLGSEEVAGLGEEGGDREGDDTDKTERVVGGGTPGGAGPVFSSGTLSGLMRQVHRLAEEAGVCTDQSCRSSLAVLGAAVSLPSCVDPCPTITSTSTPCPYPPVRLPPPQTGEKTPRGKSRKGGSLKVRLSKLFRTKSSSGGSGGLLDKRPSLASSTSSGGSLLDVWGSILSINQLISTFQSGRHVGSQQCVMISEGCGCQCFWPHPLTCVCSLADDFGGPLQQHGPFMERSTGASMQSLPPRPMALPPSLSTIQHSLSLPRPIPLRPDGQHPPPRLAPRCPLSRPDAGSFATSLRELEKCGWYWGPMNWEDAEMKLKGKPDGSFLVRDSSDPRYILSLSFRSQGVTHHTRMEHYRGTFSLWCHPKFEDRCHSVVEFIERAIMHSKNGKFLYFLRSRVPGLPPTPVQLLYPVSRFSSVKSLQHLCRFCIRQLVRIDHIAELPLPTPLIAYLRKFYYYDPEEEISPTLKEEKEPKEEKERGSESGGQPGVESQT
uniref:Suppressor of cytokine signaling 7 n=1 Tax=Amphilophus citrinellus TaxID=61819 RepID=A0A3Q0T711_AMPCI